MTWQLRLYSNLVVLPGGGPNYDKKYSIRGYIRGSHRKNSPLNPKPILEESIYLRILPDRTCGTMLREWRIKLIARSVSCDRVKGQRVRIYDFGFRAEKLGFQIIKGFRM